jgi:hypothetical protein
MALLKRPRRYYHGQRVVASVDLDWALAGAWRWKQEQEPGTPLPADFPYAARLEPLGYTTYEDLDGADVPELMRLGFSSSEAKAILAAVVPPDSVDYVLVGVDRIVTTPGTYVVL